MWSLFVVLVLPQRVYAEPRVVCVDPQDTELRARILGQTRDLPLEFVFIRASAPSPDFAQFAAQNAASFVVQVRALAGGVREVSVYDADTRELRTRHAQPPARTERFSHSALAETVALIVRGELTAALSAHDNAEKAAPPITSNAPTLSTPAPAREPPAAGSGTPTAPLAPAATAGARLFTLAAGMRVSAPGGGRVFVSPELSAQLRFMPVVIGLAVNTSLRSRADVRGLTIDLYKHSLSAEALGAFALSSAPVLAFALGASATAVIYDRPAITAAADSPLLPTPGGRPSLSASVGALAELRWSFTHTFGLRARVGVDVSLRRLSLLASPAGGPEMPGVLSHLDTVEPWAALHVFADL